MPYFIVTAQKEPGPESETKHSSAIEALNPEEALKKSEIPKDWWAVHVYPIQEDEDGRLKFWMKGDLQL